MFKTKISKRRWLLMPIETKVRELDAKILQSCVAAERGWGSIIGRKSIVRGRQDVLPKGTFIEKSASPGRMEDIENVQKYGNKVSAWCEEGLIYWDGEEYCQRRIDPQSFSAMDFFFTWGKKQADDISSNLKKDTEKLVITGNPRFDLLLPEFRNFFLPSSQKLRAKYGKIILINTKFGAANHGKVHVDKYLDYLRSLDKVKTPRQEELQQNFINFQKDTLPYFEKMIPLLSAKYPGYTIIVRPHPAENNDFWINQTKYLPNVHVVYEGNVSEWLMASEVMIHNNCTTGVEAFMLGKPSISYRAVKYEKIESELTRKLSLEVTNQTELIALVDKFLGKEQVMTDSQHKERVEYANYYLENLEGGLASEKVMNSLEMLDLPRVSGVFPLKQSIRANLRKIFNLIFTPKQVTSKKYAQKKFPGIDLQEIKEGILNLQMASGRFENVRVVKVDDDTFCIYKP